MDFGDRRGEAEKLRKEATKLITPTFLGMRLKGNWPQATPLFERAALLFRQSKDSAAAMECWERAAQGHVAQKSAWHAAKAMERAGEMAKETRDWAAVQAHFLRSSELYLEEGRPSNAAEALMKCAKALEEAEPAAASKLYQQAIGWLEDSGKDALAADMYRQAVGHAVRCERWAEAVAALLRFAASCAENNATNSLVKAYLGAVVIWLHAGDAAAAWQTYQDSLAVAEFSSSEEAFAAEELLQAYRSAEEEAVAGVVKNRMCFSHLEPAIARLARKLPSGDLALMAGQLGAVPGRGMVLEEDVEEEDLT